jgi:uridine monophosphate synthetase
MSFFSSLSARVDQVDSLLCIGLDPHPEDLPQYTAEAAKGFCMQLIESTYTWQLHINPMSLFLKP